MSALEGFLPDLSWEAAREALAGGAVGLLPIGATEAHGPHLPLGTDVYLSLELCARVRTALEQPALILPPVTLTVTRCAAGFPGTVSLPPEVVGPWLAAYLDGLAESGFARVALVNSHLEPGHVSLLIEAARRQEGPEVVFVDHCRKPWALELGEEFKSGDCHAGAYETSMMLASRFADRVDVAAAQTLEPRFVGLIRHLREGTTDFTAMGADQAYFGDPAASAIALGESIWSTLTRMWVEALVGGATTK